MNRETIKELHYITHIDNVPSILKWGIYSHNQSKKVGHRSIAMPEIQNRRVNKKIPGAGLIHDYAPLYFDAHNPMLSKVRGKNNEICILSISPDVLSIDKVVVADKNASSDYVGFYPVKEGLAVIDKEIVFARFWTHDDPIENLRHRSAKCAEVLIPNKVEPKYIRCAYVANDTALERLKKIGFQLQVEVKTDIFF